MTKTKNLNKIKKTREDWVVDIIVYVIMFVVFLACLYPFWYAIVISFNKGTDAARGGIFFWPRAFTLENYEHVLSDDSLLRAYVVTIARTLIGTVTSVLFTALFAYALSHSKLMFRKFYSMMLIISMYFSGGLIPYFVLIKRIGLMNTFWVYIIPSLLSAFNAIIMMSFFREIPGDLEESAKVDGANDVTIFFRIIFPISTPVLSTVALFNGVGHWNAWFDSAYYVTDKNLKTVAFRLMELINQANLTSISGMDATSQRAGTAAAATYTAETIRMATMIVVIVPIIMVYPFLQKYFVKGIMIGSIKG